MYRLIILILITLSFCKLKAQVHIPTDTITTNTKSAVEAHKIASDSLCSTFFIVVTTEVKPHYHAHHTENVIVTEGTGIMKLGDKEFKIKKGDIIVIPKGTIHSVKCTGKKPLKAVSVQSPYFDGKDRIMVEN